MNLGKGQARGSYKILVDKTNKIQCIRWVDSKVVNVVTTLLKTEIIAIKRQVGRNKETFTCPAPLGDYQENMQR